MRQLYVESVHMRSEIALKNSQERDMINIFIFRQQRGSMNFAWMTCTYIKAGCQLSHCEWISLKGC
jgi:hypothetical protein